MADDPKKPTSNQQETEALLRNLRDLIQGARQKALRAVDAVQVQTCWKSGRYITEFEQGGASRATYSSRLLSILAESLSREFGRGFDVTNLRHMRVFYQAFPIRDALRPELSWTHYRTLLKVDQEEARSWYMAGAASQGWTTRALEGSSALYITSGCSRLLINRLSSKRPEARSPCSRLLGTLCGIRSCWSFLVFRVLGVCSRPISNEPFSTTCKRFFSSLGAASPS